MKREQLPEILVVDDDDSHRLMLSTMLTKWGWTTSQADDGTSAVAAVRERSFDAILMDIKMTNMDGIEALKIIHRHNPAIPVVIMTAFSSVDSAVKAIKIGAHDYLTKPLDFTKMKRSLDKVLKHKQSLKTDRDSGDDCRLTPENTGILGNSPEVKKLLKMIDQVAPTEATVLISGDSGTGKELVASALHHFSIRKNGPFIKINCAALVDNLLESELFGHEKGAFTGADKKRDGKFILADRGTIFLDEIGETSPSMQAKLLRVLQESEIQRVGGDKTIKVNVRVIAASNKVLEHEVENNNFREDLYYRLNVVTISIPGLKDRREDIPILTDHFAKKYAKKNNRIYAGITPGCINIMLNYPWPGNVRELENAVERGIILMQGDYLDEDALPLSLRNWSERNKSSPFLGNNHTPETLEDAEKQVIVKTLNNTGWNKSEAARRLNITRKTLQSKLVKYDIQQR